ncbi:MULTISPECIES: hypothetical protein [Vibrio]|uniref:hypothetical protein n=1 Tax=Vibrio TaxID=662 RepID=UPI000B8E3875|nr:MULTISPECIES: hypothetical protein [Vibrio]OXX29113.1 hypothetical protein B9J92_02470 [Vibrio sp. V08_P9A1T1]TYC93834.1 hypothetical protein FXB64_05435 [Vibrio anguillarum]TYC97387.1 hypothetical protein FXB62_04010 [Vibrio anguillarum]
MLYQIYAYLTDASWQQFAQPLFPDAIDVAGYRLCVFTNRDTPFLKTFASEHGFIAQRLSVEQTIKAMEGEEAGPFVCDLESAKAIKQHFEPDIQNY